MLLFCQASLDKLSRINDKLCKRTIKQFLMRKLGCVFWKTQGKVQVIEEPLERQKQKLHFPICFLQVRGFYMNWFVPAWRGHICHNARVGGQRTTFGDRVSPSTMWAPGIELGSLGLAAKPLLTEPPRRTQLRVSWVFSAFSITRRSVLGCPCPSEESFGSQIYQPLFQISSQPWFHFFLRRKASLMTFPFIPVSFWQPLKFW